MKEERSDLPQKKKSNSKTIFYILGSIVMVGAIAGGSFYAGLKVGQKQGSQLVQQKISEALNPLNLISNNPLIPNSVIGSITKTGNGTISVKLATGEEKSVSVNSETQITQQSKTLTANDLKSGQQVTVFYQKNGDDQTATRILVR